MPRAPLYAMYGSTDNPAPPSTLGVDEKEYSSEALLDWGPEDMSIDRKLLISGLEARIQRARHCRSVPESVIVYIIFIVSLLVRIPVDKTFQFERGIVDSIVNNNAMGSYYPTNAPEWFDWLKLELLPVTVTSSDYNGNLLPPGQRGRVSNGLGLIVGGIRLVQTRLAPGPCSLPPDSSLDLAYGIPCFSEGDLSLSSDFGNASAAADYGVSSAFLPSTVAGDNSIVEAFEWTISTNITIDEAQVQVDGLRAAYWLDEATRSVAVQFVVLNGQEGLWSWVSMHTDFTRGGRGVPKSHVGTVPVRPYYFLNKLQGGVVLCDALMMLYWIYLAFGTSRRLGSIITNRSITCYQKFSGLTSWWRVLDVVAVASLLTTIVTWGLLVSECTIAQSKISIGLASEAFSAGPEAIQWSIYTALHYSDQFKIAAVVTLVVLTMRLFKYFKHQPRLAVLTDAIAMGLGDSLHFGMLLGVILVMYGAWGHFMFGSQAPDWSTVLISIPTTVRYMMYDYDLDAMTASYPAMAYLFFISFMLIVTNLVFYMFLAIILESYTVVRQESLLGPSAWSELVTVTMAMPSFIPHTVRVALCSWCYPRRQVPVRVAWADITKALKTGPLSRSALITPAQLVATLRMNAAEATTLVRELALEGSRKLQHDASLRQSRAMQPFTGIPDAGLGDDGDLSGPVPLHLRAPSQRGISFGRQPNLGASPKQNQQGNPRSPHFVGMPGMLEEGASFASASGPSLVPRQRTVTGDAAGSASGAGATDEPMNAVADMGDYRSPQLQAVRPGSARGAPTLRETR